MGEDLDPATNDVTDSDPPWKASHSLGSEGVVRQGMGGGHGRTGRTGNRDLHIK